MVSRFVNTSESMCDVFPTLALLRSGNEVMHQLTWGTTSSLYFKLQALDGMWFWAEYSNFSIGPECDNYRLTFDPYSLKGDAGKPFISVFPKQK